MTSTLPSVSLGLVLIGAAGCDFSREWQGFVYPDRPNPTSVYVGKFKTLEACRAAARATLGENRGDYECGLNCKPHGGINVCSRTER